VSDRRPLACLTLALALLLRLFAVAAAQPSAAGSVMVFGERGGRLLLDGQPVGELPLSRPLSVPAGAHRLVLDRAGTQTQAQLTVRRGRLIEVRFDRESGAVAVSQPPAALLFVRLSGFVATDEPLLRQAASRAMDDERLLRVEPSVEKAGAGAASACTQIDCQAAAAAQDDVPYALSLEATAGPEAPSDVKLSVRIIDATIGDAAATKEKLCTGCSAAQASEQLAQLLRLAIVEGTSRQRGRLEIRSRPPGATVEVNGRDVGKTPIARVVWTGNIELLARHPGYLPERQRVVVRDGRTTDVELVLQEQPVVAAPQLPAPQPVETRFERAPRPRWRLAAGGAMLGGGVLFLGFGGGALAVAGDCISEAAPPAQRCDRLYDTRGLGTGLTIVGAALSVTGAVLLALPGPRRAVARSTPTQPVAAEVRNDKGASIHASAKFGDASQHGDPGGNGKL
jgi:hypothetical protein